MTKRISSAGLTASLSNLVISLTSVSFRSQSQADPDFCGLNSGVFAFWMIVSMSGVDLISSKCL